MKKIILLSICLLLTGCFNYTELNKILSNNIDPKILCPIQSPITL